MKFSPAQPAFGKSYKNNNFTFEKGSEKKWNTREKEAFFLLKWRPEDSFSLGSALMVGHCRG